MRILYLLFTPVLLFPIIAKCQENIFSPPSLQDQENLGKAVDPQSYLDSAGNRVEITIPRYQRFEKHNDFFSEMSTLSKLFADQSNAYEESVKVLPGLDAAQRNALRAARASTAYWKQFPPALEHLYAVRARVVPWHPKLGELDQAIAEISNEEKAARARVKQDDAAYQTAYHAWNAARFAPYWNNRSRFAVQRNFLANFAYNADFHRPATVIEVRLQSRLGNAYAAKFVEDENTKKYRNALGIVTASLEAFEADLKKFDKERETDWTELKRLAKAWHALHDEQSTVAQHQYLANVFTESIDAVTSILVSENPGRVAAWELFWRTGGLVYTYSTEGAGGFKGSVKAAKTPERLLAAMLKLANTDVSAMPDVAPVSDIALMAQVGDIAKDTVVETLPSDGVEFAVNQIFELALDVGKAGPAAAATLKQEGLLEGMLTVASGIDGPASADAAKVLPKSVSDYVGAHAPSELLKEGMISAFTVGAKSVVASTFDEERIKLEAEKALLSLDYFVVRNRLQNGLTKRSDVFRILQAVLDAFERHLIEMEKPCCKRSIELADGAGVIKALEEDYDESDTVILIAITDRPVAGLRYKIGGLLEGRFPTSSISVNDRYETRVTLPITAFEEADVDGGVSLALEADNIGPMRMRLDGEPEDFAIPNGLSVESPPDGYDYFQSSPDRTHILPEIAAPGGGIYLSVIDMFGKEGLRILPAPDLHVTIHNEEGKIVAEEKTPKMPEPLFIELSDGTYKLTLETGRYFPVPAVSCDSVYELEFKLEKNKRRAFGAKVKLADVADNGTSLGSQPGDCIVEMKNSK